MRIRVIARLTAAICVAWVAGLHGQDIGKTEIRTLPIKGNLYLLQGYGGNNIVSTGADGTLLVDDEYAELAGKVAASISKLTEQPVKWLINTHWHNDHTGGNELFGRAGATIIAQENSRTRMMSDQVMSLFGKQAAYTEAGWPKISYATSMRVHFNGDDVDILYPGAAHTDGDSVVFFRKSNVIHTGDIFVRDEYLPPYFDDRNGGSTEGMIAATAALLNLVNDQTVIVPGHGKLSTRADLLDYQTMLLTMRDRIRQAIAKGQSEDEAVAAKPATGLAPAGRGTDRWVRILYREYK